MVGDYIRELVLTLALYNLVLQISFLIVGITKVANVRYISLQLYYVIDHLT